MFERFSLTKGKNKSEYTIEEIKSGMVPEHIAIIMDGNGRWAKKRGLPRMAGHHEGMQTVRKIVRHANSIGVKALTLYAFSTENWKRPKIEVDYLMKLPGEFLSTFLPELMEENVQVRIMGNKEELPTHTKHAIENAVKDTSSNTGLILNFALNYGSRNEIVLGIQGMINDVTSGKVSIEEISEETFSQYLLSSELKDPDLLIRTSGEVRLSNFMLWQLAYTEFWFTDVLWPDFKEQHFLKAIGDFQRRGRRFGGV
jgi:undecaprenyl diphosphate synthase